MASPGDGNDAANILARAVHHDAMDATLNALYATAEGRGEINSEEGGNEQSLWQGTTDPVAGGVAPPTWSKKAKHQREFVPKRQIHDRKPSPVTSVPIRIPGKMLNVLYATAEGRREINSEEGGSDQSLRQGTTDPLAGVAPPTRSSRKAKHQREFVLKRQILARKPSPVTIVPTRIPGHNLSLLCPHPNVMGQLIQYPSIHFEWIPDSFVAYNETLGLCLLCWIQMEE
jgi:hypothetical protein